MWGNLTWFAKVDKLHIGNTYLKKTKPEDTITTRNTNLKKLVAYSAIAYSTCINERALNSSDLKQSTTMIVTRTWQKKDLFGGTLAQCVCFKTLYIS